MNLNARLRRLEARAPAGCRACTPAPGTLMTFVMGDQRLDAPGAQPEPLPAEACAACGRVCRPEVFTLCIGD